MPVRDSSYLELLGQLRGYHSEIYCSIFAHVTRLGLAAMHLISIDSPEIFQIKYTHLLLIS